jgi:hypothetical protein
MPQKIATRTRQIQGRVPYSSHIQITEANRKQQQTKPPQARHLAAKTAAHPEVKRTATHLLQMLLSWMKSIR